MKRVLGIAAVLLAITAPSLAAAVTVDFSTLASSPGGNLGIPTTTDNQIVIDAFSVSGSAYTQTDTTIFIRNDGPNDNGLGVCNPGQQSDSACAAVGTFTGSGGDINEVDNASVGELIRLTLPANSTWISVVISSLDCNGSTDCSNPESGQLWYSNNDNLAGTTDLSTFATKFTDYVGTSDTTAYLTIDLSGPAASAQYLYFVPTGSATNNDHLVWQASYDSTTRQTVVPVPPGWLLLGVGLVAFAVRGRRHS